MSTTSVHEPAHHLSTSEIRLLDATDACKASQAALTGSLGRIEGQIGELVKAGAAIEKMAAVLSWLLTPRGIVLLLVLVYGPEILRVVGIGTVLPLNLANIAAGVPSP